MRKRKKKLKIVNMKRFIIFLCFVFLLFVNVVYFSIKGFISLAQTLESKKNPEIIIAYQITENPIEFEDDILETKKYKLHYITHNRHAEERINNFEIELLAKCMKAEAEIDGILGEMAVGIVVMNRVKSEHFPNTIEEVITQEKQFSSYWNGKLLEQKITEKDLILAKEIIKYHEQYAKELGLEKALYFMNRKLSNPDNVEWFDKNLKFVKVIGNHEFFKPSQDI